MFVNLLFYFAFGMIILEKTSKYFFVSCVTEDDSSLGSLVFVSAVSIVWYPVFAFILFNLKVTTCKMPTLRRFEDAFHSSHFILKGYKHQGFGFCQYT